MAAPPPTRSLHQLTAETKAGATPAAMRQTQTPVALPPTTPGLRKQLVPYDVKDAKATALVEVDDKDGTRERDFKSLEAGVQIVDQQFYHDEKRTDLLDQLNSHQNGYYHYDKTRLSLRRHVAIPQPIIDQYDNLECKSFVGLFPEISRAYITIDNKLFLWNYHDGSDFYMYDELGQIIITSALIRPKPGVFVEQIKFVIVVATPVEIVMLGVVFEGDNVYGELTLYPTQFVVPSDNVHMLKIVGTPDGRVIMCGKDGNVYELDYQAADGWFRKKCRKLNHSKSVLYSYLPSFLFGSSEDPIVDVVIDSSRSPLLLYALSKRNVVSVYGLGKLSDPNRNLSECSLITRCDTILHACHEKLGPAKLTEDWDHKKFVITNIHPVHRPESERVHLVATTDRGHRIYFSLTATYGLTSMNTYELRVRFVRLCPPYVVADVKERDRPLAPNYKYPESPQQVRKTYYGDGVLLLADARRTASDGDTLVALTPDHTAASSNPALNETVESVPMNIRISDVNEIPSSFYLTLEASCLYARGSSVPLVGLSEFATQHALPPRQFLVLTSSGLLTYIKSRPVDELRKLLVARIKSTDDTEIQRFFAKYGVKEACAMCLIIACAAPNQYSVADLLDASLTTSKVLSKNADEKHGAGALARFASPMANGAAAAAAAGAGAGAGRAALLASASKAKNDVTSPNRYAVTKVTDDELEMWARQAFFRFGSITPEMKPMVAQAMTGLLGGVVPSTKMQFSGKHDGLCLYLARLLRAVWEWSITIQPDPKKNPRYLRLRFNKEQLLHLQAPLQRLYRFIEQNKAEFTTLPNYRRATAEAERVAKKELEDFEHVRSLLEMCVEGFYLLTVLAEHEQFPRIVARLTDTEFVALKDLRFSEFVSQKKGENIARSLIAALMSLNADDNQWIGKLSTHCPTYFGKSDLLHYKALEALNKSRAKFAVKAERLHYSKEALHAYRRAAHNRKFPLEDAVRSLREVHFYTGVVDLCLHRAQLVQQHELRGPVPPGLPAAAFNQFAADGAEFQKQQAEEKRCYDCILDTLTILIFRQYRDIAEEGKANSKAALPLDAADRAIATEKVISLCLESENLAFLDALYQWFIRKELKENLFKVKSPSVVRFLTSNEAYVDILREYYLRNEMFKPAAILLCELAYKKTDRYTLSDRLGFLSRAHVCALSCVDADAAAGVDRRDEKLVDDGNHVIDGDMVFRLADRIEIAKIQLKIYNALKAMAEQRERVFGQGLERDDKEKELRVRTRMVVGELDRELFDLDNLYVYAQSFGLWEECLAIIHFSERKDQEKVIRALWKNIIRQEIQLCESAKTDWSSAVRDKIVALSKRYADVPFMFPLEFICKELEEYNTRLRWRAPPSKHFVMQTLLEAKIQPNALIGVYDRMIETLAEWLADRNAWVFVYHSVYNLLEYFANAQRAAGAVRGAAAAAGAAARFSQANGLAVINKCKSNLYAHDTEPAKELMAQFDELETRFHP